MTVRRDRHNWPVGYFTALVGARIAFLGDDDRPARGYLESVDEGEHEIALWLTDVRPEIEDDD